jgi:hypothetical protein
MRSGKSLGEMPRQLAPFPLLIYSPSRYVFSPYSISNSSRTKGFMRHVVSRGAAGLSLKES